MFISFALVLFTLEVLGLSARAMDSRDDIFYGDAIDYSYEDGLSFGGLVPDSGAITIVGKNEAKYSNSPTYVRHMKKPFVSYYKTAPPRYPWRHPRMFKPVAKPKYLPFNSLGMRPILEDEARIEKTEHLLDVTREIEEADSVFVPFNGNIRAHGTVTIARHF